MKKLLTILIMLFTINSISQKQINFAGMTFEQDKLYHAGVGTAIGGAFLFVDYDKNKMNPFAATLVSLCVATGKEMFDSFNGGRFNFKDIAWTVTPTFTIDLGRLVFKKRKKPIVIEEDFNPPLVKKN